MGTVIVIPARLAAHRLPNKPLAALGGLPLVVRTAQQAQKCLKVDAVIVATDEPTILEAVRAHGIEGRLTEREHRNGSERVAEVNRSLGADRVVNLQGDEPFIEPRDLETVIDALSEEGVDLATLGRPIASADELHDPNLVKLVTDDRDRALYFSRAPIPRAHDGVDPIAGARAHIGVYGFQRAALERFAAAPVNPLEQKERLEQLRALGLGMTILVCPALTESRGINSENDLLHAQERVNNLGEAAFPS